ncbi:MAG: helix-turn-helix domain-containing protein [Limisphaerales bacterium]
MKRPKTQKKTVLSREAQIGVRLREAREFLHLSQKEFAERIGIKRVRLASYEAGRVPLRWEIALRACQRFLISECWLATGRDRLADSKTPAPFGNTVARAVMFQPADPVFERLKPGDWFSHAYDSELSLAYWKRLATSARAYRKASFASEPSDPERVRALTEWALTLWFSMIPVSRRKRFCAAITKAGGLLFDTLYESPSDDGKRKIPLSRIEKLIEDELPAATP